MKAYMPYIKLAILAILLSVSFLRGCSVQKARDAQIIQQKDDALRAASESLKASASALRAQNEANAKALKEAEEARKNAKNAGVVSDASRAASEKRKQGFQKLLNTAAKSPVCKALLETDINKACGL